MALFFLTIPDTERVAAWLRTQGISAEAYHSQSADREELEQKFLRNDLKALPATVALGMGFDKPDIGFVIHFQRPASVVAYYQQIGRAGRAVENAYCIMLSDAEDEEIQDDFVESAFPPAHLMEQVHREIANSFLG